MYKLLIIENGTYIHRDSPEEMSIPSGGVLLYSEEEIKKYCQRIYPAVFDTIEEIEEIFTGTKNWQEVRINGKSIILNNSSRYLFEIVEV